MERIKKIDENNNRWFPAGHRPNVVTFGSKKRKEKEATPIVYNIYEDIFTS